MDFDEVVDEFARRRTDASDTGADSTGERYARDIRNQWRPWLQEEHDISVWEAETGHVEDYLRHLSREGYAESTMNVRLSAISLFYQELWKMYREPGYKLPSALTRRYQKEGVEDFEEANPVSDIKREDYGLQGRSRTKKSDGLAGTDSVPYLTPEEVQELEQHVPAPRRRNELIIRLLFTTGMRRQELAKMRCDGVNRDDRIIEVPAVKSRDGRRVTYPPSVDPLLTEWLDLGGREAVPSSSRSPYLFPTERRDHITEDRVNTMAKEAAENAGLQEVINVYSDGREMSRVTTHTLRHSYGVQAVKSNIDVRSIQKLLGHANIETTEIYLEIADDDLLDRSRRFEPDFPI